jgi:hypothetical protein
VSVSLFDARHIWSMLVAYAGATDTDSNWVSFRQWFDRAIECGQDEYRFMGLLGYGGKFWVSRDGFHVSCYPEDETPARLRIIEETNAVLRGVWAVGNV